jgi:hypothetical protein
MQAFHGQGQLMERSSPNPKPYALNHALHVQGQLMEQRNIDKIRHIPCIAVQGAADLICPPGTALDLRVCPSQPPDLLSMPFSSLYTP